MFCSTFRRKLTPNFICYIFRENSRKIGKTALYSFTEDNTKQILPFFFFETFFCVFARDSSTRFRIENSTIIVKIMNMKPTTDGELRLRQKASQTLNNHSIKTRDAQASLGYTDRCIRCDGRPLTPALCIAEQ